jgi:hypothetical protein
MTFITWLIWFVVILFFYLLPTMVANSRWSQNTWLVFFLNLFFWWTGLVWFVCIFIAISWKSKKDRDREDDFFELMKKNNEK